MISSSIKSAISDIPFWKKNALARAVFQFFIVVKPAQQVLADLMRIGNAGRHCPSSFTFSTGSSLKTLDDTNLKLLASPAHSDAQSVWPSHAVRQLLSNLNLAMSSIPVVTHDYIAVGWGEPAQTAIQTCELLFAHAALKTLRRRNVHIQRIRLILSEGCSPDISCHSVTVGKRLGARFARFYFSNHNINHLSNNSSASLRPL